MYFCQQITIEKRINIDLVYDNLAKILNDCNEIDK